MLNIIRSTLLFYFYLFECTLNPAETPCDVVNNKAWALHVCYSVPKETQLLPTRKGTHLMAALSRKLSCGITRVSGDDKYRSNWTWLPVYLGIMWYCRVGVVPDIIINVAPRWSLQLTNHVRCFFLEVEHQHGDISWSNGDVNFRKSCPARLYRCLPLFLVFMRTRLAAATDTRLVFIFIYLIIQWKVNKPTPMCIWGSCMRTL